MGKVMLATGLIVAYGYMSEIFTAWYSGNIFEGYLAMNRAFGPYWVVFWGVLACNVVAPQFLWNRKIRLNVKALFTVAMAVNIGMWIERFMIIVVSLHRDFMPSAWGMYYPTRWDIITFFGTVGLFLTLVLLFIRFLPLISIFEMRQLVSSHASERAEGREL
jgi:Ni/Fe-hydrogenase subunit HybB-like protein